MSLFRLLSVALVLIALSTFVQAAPAQTSIYASGAATSFGFSGQSYAGGTELKPRTSGFTAGAIYTLPGLSRLRYGLDGRYTFAPGYNGGKAYTAAIRMSFVPNRLPFQPYGEFGGGAASTQLRQSCSGLSCATTTTQLTSGVVHYGAGLDIRLNRLFDLRAFDFQYDTGGGAGVTHAAMQAYSAGLVFHLRAPTIGGR